MKRILFVFGFLLFLSNSLFAQQFPNSSFESWSAGEPDHWTSSNQSLLGLVNFTMVSEDLTDPESGSASVKLTVVTQNIPFAGSYTLPGVLTLGKLNIDPFTQTATITGGYPFTGQPEKLTGYYKYQPVNNDMCIIGWGTTRWNNGIRDTLAYGVSDTNVVLDTWTYFEVPLRYKVPGTPDTMNIVILNSNPFDGRVHTGTTMWVDNLSFEYGSVGIEGLPVSEQLNIYAEPHERKLLLTSAFAQQQNLDIGLFSMNGTESKHWNLSMQQSTETLDISNLPTGTYIIRVTSGKRLIDSRKITVIH